MSVFTNPAAAASEHATAYISAVLQLLGDRDPLKVFRETPGALSLHAAQMEQSELARPEAPLKWSVRDVLQHLADSEIVWSYRVRMVLAQERPQLTGYDQDLWADRLDYRESDSQQALSIFSVLRAANLQLMERASAADLQRVGVHAERGEQTLEDMMRLYAGHDLVHLRQIERIRQALRRD